MTVNDRNISRVVRAALNQSGTPWPIKVVDGFDEPEVKGRSYYWTTPSGLTEVRHPNAYGWPTKYHASTRHIVVGAGWVIEALLNEEAERKEVNRKRRDDYNLLMSSIGQYGAVAFDAEGCIRRNVS